MNSKTKIRVIQQDPELERLAVWLAGYLYTCARGKPLALKWEDLLGRARAFYSQNVAYSVLRNAKEYLLLYPVSIFEMRQRIQPVCSGPEGIWYADSNEEGTEAADYLHEKGMDLIAKAANLKAAVDDLYTPQTKFPGLPSAPPPERTIQQ